MDNNSNGKMRVSLLAVDPFVVTNIVEPTEYKPKDKSFVCWGENNSYPDYLNELYKKVSTLRSIINGIVDYVNGNNVTTMVENFKLRANSKGDTIEDIVKWITLDFVKYGGFALNIVKNRLGTVAEIHYLDFKRVRSSEDGYRLYYSTDWSKSFGRVKYTEYENFLRSDKPSTIFYYKEGVNTVYPEPMYAASVVACEIEKQLNEYHLNNIVNGFSSNYIINFNSGMPSDEIKMEIEDEVYDKFCGSENAGRPMLSFNDTKENETTVTKIEADGFIDKYNSLAGRTKQEIFTSFRCSPILFGIDQEKTGFNANEYAAAFRLFNKTVIEPIQRKIVKAFDKIFGVADSLVIEPFAINFDKEINA